MAGVRGSTDYAELADADLVIEAVFEEIGVKRAVFAELGRVCRADAVLATNTSYLDPRAIAAGLPDPSRFIGLHFFSPAHIMKLLEIVPTPDTAPDVLATGFALGRSLNKMPVQAGICEGFIGNRILKRYRAEAEGLVTQGVAIAEIDAAMRGYGFRMGPFEAQDLGGLDIAFLQREVLGARIRMIARRSEDFLGAAAAAALPDGRPRPAEDVLAQMQLPELHEDEGAVADHGGGVVYGGEQQVDTLRPLGRGHDGDDCGGERAKHEPHEAQHTLTTVKDAVAFVPAAGQPEGELGDEERKRGK